MYGVIASMTSTVPGLAAGAPQSFFFIAVCSSCDFRAVQRVGAAKQLEAVVLRPVVAARDDHGAIGLEMVSGEVQHRRGNDADVQHVYPALGDTGDKGGVDAW